LCGHEEVRAAAVLLRADPVLGERLVAYLAPEPGAHPAVDELRGYLAGRLPEHMVPSSFVLLPALPLSANGKVDRRALARVEGEREAVAGYAAPRTPVEEVLCEIWGEVLGLDRVVGVEDNFFALGGHSLLATQVASRVYQDFGIELPVR